MLAMVFGVLAPTVAQAMVAAADKGEWVEVCSASGMVWLKAGATDLGDVESGQNMPMADMNSHCPWCSFHGSAAGLPMAALVTPSQPFSAQSLPIWIGASPNDAVWHTAQARAPPFAS